MVIQNKEMYFQENYQLLLTLIVESVELMNSSNFLSMWKQNLGIELKVSGSTLVTSLMDAFT